MGGGETLILRLMRWYITHEYRAILLTLDKTIDNAILKDFNDINSEYYVYDRKKSYFYTSIGKKLSFTPIESVTALTFSVDDFSIFYKYLSYTKYNCQFKHRIYCINLASCSFFSLLRQPIIMKQFICSLIKHKMLVFMDEYSCEVCIDLYGLRDTNLNFEILRLPIEINNDTISKPKHDKVSILSVARFDFPFKGYILGLIDTFKTIALSTDKIALTIIGYGKGEDSVNQKLIALPKEIRNRIKILNKIPYSEIATYIDQCDLFVGMGTTALDAANRNKICIVPVPYQKSDLSTGFFHDDYTTLGYNLMVTNSHFPELISQILSVENKIFIKKEDLSKSLLVKYYDIDKIAPLFVAKEFYGFSFFEKIYLAVLYYLVLLKRAIKKELTFSIKKPINYSQYVYHRAHLRLLQKRSNFFKKNYKG
jgi:hypothetical protein